MINGGFTGGSTNGGSGSFKVGSAYLVNLIASSVDMAESLGMTKLVLAGLELGGVIGSLLGVATLLLCVTLFVLAVEEYNREILGEVLESGQIKSFEGLSNATAYIENEAVYHK